MGGAYLAAAEQTLHTGAALCAAAQKSAKSLFPGLRNAASCALRAASGFLSKLCVGGEPLPFFLRCVFLLAALVISGFSVVSPVPRRRFFIRVERHVRLQSVLQTILQQCYIIMYKITIKKKYKSRFPK